MKQNLVPSLENVQKHNGLSEVEYKTLPLHGWLSLSLSVWQQI